MNYIQLTHKKTLDSYEKTLNLVEKTLGMAPSGVRGGRPPPAWKI